MNQYLIGGLVANAASLGFHWVYNPEYLEALSKKQSLLFQLPNLDQYKEAGKSYFAYPHAKIGDFTSQGMFLIWLYEAMKKNPDFTQLDYENLIYSKVRPGGDYIGYVESYSKILVFNKLNVDLNLSLSPLDKEDDHLVGFIPYLACKELNLSNEKAWDLAQLFTNKTEYLSFYHAFDYIFEGIGKKPLSELLKESIVYAPIQYQNKLSLALEMTDTKKFIKEQAGISCHIPYSIPLIYHILNFSKSFESAVEWNTKIGGASSDRGLMLGAIMSKVYPVQKNWINKISVKG